MRKRVAELAGLTDAELQQLDQRVNECTSGFEHISVTEHWRRFMAVCHGNAHFGFQGDGGIECASIIATHSGVRHGDTCVDLVVAVVMLAFLNDLW